MGDKKHFEHGFWKDWRGILEKKDWADFREYHSIPENEKLDRDLLLPEYQLLIGQRGILFNSEVSGEQKRMMIEEGLQHDKLMRKESFLAIKEVLNTLKIEFDKFDIQKKVFRIDDYEERTNIFVLCLNRIEECINEKQTPDELVAPEKQQVFIQVFERNFDIMTDFTKNVLLAQYYLKMKKMLKSMFISSLVAERQIFTIRDDTYAMTVKSISAVIPLFGQLIGAAGVTWNMTKKLELSRKLSRIADLAINYDQLEDLIARTMTLLRRNVIISCSGYFNTKKNPKEYTFEKWNVTKKLWDLLKKDALTESEILATNDTHIVEGCMVYIIEHGLVDLINFPSVSNHL